MKHIFSTTIILLSLMMYVFGVGSCLLAVPEEGISRFLMLLGGFTTLIGIRMQRVSHTPQITFPKVLALISFFVFVGGTVIALITIFRETSASMIVIVFSLGCAILTAVIHGVMELAAEPRA